MFLVSGNMTTVKYMYFQENLYLSCCRICDKHITRSTLKYILLVVLKTIQLSALESIHPSILKINYTAVALGGLFCGTCDNYIIQSTLVSIRSSIPKINYTAVAP